MAHGACMPIAARYRSDICRHCGAKWLSLPDVLQPIVQAAVRLFALRSARQSVLQGCPGGIPTPIQSSECSMTIKALVFDAYGTLYDVQSVAAVTEEAFPGYGEIVTQIWRIKQLEYTWLRSLMRRHEDLSVITRDSLVYTLNVLGLKYDSAGFERIMDKYLHLDLYPDAMAALTAMKARKLAILSNGSTEMLIALVHNSGID